MRIVSPAENSADWPPRTSVSPTMQLLMPTLCEDELAVDAGG